MPVSSKDGGRTVKEKIIKIITLISIVLLSTSMLSIDTFASSVKTSDIPDTSYTYWVDDTKTYSGKASYVYAKEMNAKSLGYEYKSLSDISASDDEIYILDGVDSSVFVLDKNLKKISSFKGVTVDGKPLDFTGASGILYNNDELYICDTENQRVIICDKAGNGKRVLELPDSELIPEDFKFRPIKVAVDSKNNIYVLSEGSFYGAILYSSDGSFLGFYGSNTVEAGVITALKNLWEKITMTNEKRAFSASKIPYQFVDLYIDSGDFVYTATGITKKDTVESGQIKRLNPGGSNILEESSDTIFGDRATSSVWFRGAGWTVSSSINGVVSDENKFIYCFDQNRGKVFIYDDECNFISSVGGGNGDVNQKGMFSHITGIDLLGTDLIVIDDQKKNITVFERSSFGNLLMEAQRLQLLGDYDKAKELWVEVNKLDKNNQLAYIGLAKAAYSEGEYKASMEYAKLAKNKEMYDLAYEYVRNDNFSKYFTPVILTLAFVVIGLYIAIKYRRKSGKRIAVSNSIKMIYTSVSSPIKTFGEIKPKGVGSVGIAALIVIVFYFSSVIKSLLTGYQFQTVDNENFSSLLLLLQTVGVIVLFTIANYAIASLLQGRGKLKEIFIVVCYSLTPMIIGNIVYTVFSNMLTLSEAPFLAIISTIFILYTAFMLIGGLMIIHDITLSRFIGIMLLTVFAMIVVIFVGVIVIILAQQLFTFFGTVFNELVFR